MSRRRHLSEEEEALWRGFTRSIVPLRPTKNTPANSERKIAAPAPAAKPGSPAPAPASIPRGTEPPPAASPLSPFDRRLKKRVARGRESINARLDLHGLTQTQAHAALWRFLRRAQADGVKIALIVTGKGASRGHHDLAEERGVLKRQVPLWLALPEFRPLVVGIERAHAFHGGEGALYVRIRRPR